MNTSPIKFPVKNNIDILRLFAAMQVVALHTVEHLYQIPRDGSIVLLVLGFIPGVPIFFFLSGLLIPQSYERTPSLREYIYNRALRLYPALLVCIVLSSLMMVVVGYMEWVDFKRADVLTWLVTQATFLQFYNPEFFYGFGTGVVNTSLWTISVEIQFYIITPALVYLLRYKRLYFSLFLLSLLLNVALQHFDLRHFLWGKFLRVSFLPWIFMFMTGHLVYVYWERVARFVQGKIYLWAAIFALQVIFLAFIEREFGYNLSGNSIIPLTFFLLSFLVLSVAVSWPSVSGKILYGNDFSYGVYIYHMPIINLFLYLALPVGILSTVLISVLIFSLACLSWVLVERPALRLKHISIYPR
ncbi:acyltransferase [Roseovarius nubinhibens]|uniref:acyltransferase family protein n=1 Tax=Roseovarius nubinhibens TaxID=314263 RepID=UPI001C08069E|nr:acyltransferase [Roseovarius nubinhibens]MBU2999827.1 acyltransferase [Roseovarius nubinhibens]